MKSPVSRLALWLSAVAVLIALALNVLRIVRQYDDIGGAYDRTTIGLFDFHNGVYTPSRAFIDGVNPYGQILLDRGYPMARPSPSYGPSHFLIHVPLALLPLHAAEAAYLAITLLAYFAIVAIPVYELFQFTSQSADTKTILGGRNFWFYSLAGLAVLLISRPGHVNFVTGYFTAELVLGTIATLFLARKHPYWAGLTFVLACGKPTYALPLVCVLFILGMYRALFAGIAIGGLFNVAALLWLLRFDTVSGFLASVKEGQAQHMADPIETPVVSWLRIDWTAIIAKWMNWNPFEIIQVAVMLALYLVVWICVIASSRNRQPTISSNQSSPLVTTAVGTLCLSSILLFIYHHVYDALLVVPAIVALSLNVLLWTRGMPTYKRIGLLLLFSSPLWNYFSSETVLTRLPDLWWLRNFVTSWNCLAVSVGALLVLPYVWRGNTQNSSGRPSLDAKAGAQANLAPES